MVNEFAKNWLKETPKPERSINQDPSIAQDKKKD